MGHPAGVPRAVLHVDLDQFVVAVELRRRPELRGQPVLVGGTGDPTARGVVAGASYEARAHGVRSGTPLRHAARRCPDAVLLPVDRPLYEAASAEVMAVLAAQSPVVEPLGWDEAFLAVEAADPLVRAGEVQAAVREATGLSCSVGVGDNRLQAKTATGFGKPGGVFALSSSTWADVMAERPCDALHGVGSRTATALAGLGLDTVGALAAADPAVLAAAFGPRTGPRLVTLARGEDSAEVRAAARPARSLGRETTFQQDVEDAAVVQEALRRLTTALHAELARQPRDVVRVVVVLRTRPFRTRTRGVRLTPPTREPGPLQHAAAEALALLLGDDPVRLVGVRAELAPA